MHINPIHLSDWHRILFGKPGPLFLPQVVLRAVASYAILLLAMRLLGRRVAGQLSLFELSVVVTMAGAIGVPLEASNRGLLPPVLIIAIIIVLQRALAIAGIRKPAIEHATSGNPTQLIIDGRMLLNTMERAGLPREQLFAALRCRYLQHLGQIQQLFLEPSGDFTIIQSRNPRPGLSLIPEIDSSLRRQSIIQSSYVCASCGAGPSRRQACRCNFCGSADWTPAALELHE
jgi:uncharacterized membrane protein YcaP (DUF421 family)